jgi:hypothetical protein
MRGDAVKKKVCLTATIELDRGKVLQLVTMLRLASELEVSLFSRSCDYGLTNLTIQVPWGCRAMLWQHRIFMVAENRSRNEQEAHLVHGRRIWQAHL